MERSRRNENHVIEEIRKIDPNHHVSVIFTISVQEKTASLIVADCR